MRFINNLGFQSFSDFKKEFHYFTLHTNKPTWWHLKKSITSDKSCDRKTTIEKTWNEIIHLMNNSLSQRLFTEFENAIKLLLKAKSINILGLRTSKVVAHYFESMLSEVYPNANYLNESDFIYDKLLHLGQEDIVVIITFSPYTTTILDIARYCYDSKIPILLITDHVSCPVYNYSQVALIVESSQNQYSIVPSMALIESLVIEFGQRTSVQSVRHLNKLNKVLKDKNITFS